MKSQRWTYRILISAIIFFAAGIAVEYVIPQYLAHHNWAAEHINHVLEKTHDKQTSLVNRIAENTGNWSLDSLHERDLNRPFHVMIYRGDSLVYWSSNAVVFEPWNLTEAVKTSYIEAENGIYRVCAKRTGNTNIYTFYKIYNKYIRSNRYFRMGFTDDFRLGNTVSLSFKPAYMTDHPVDADGKTIFYISAPSYISTGPLPYCCYAAGTVLFLWFLFLFSRSMSQQLRWRIICSGILLLLLVFAELASFGVAFFDIGNTELFSPEIAALSSTVSSLGQLLGYVIMAICLLQLAKWWLVEYFECAVRPEKRSRVIIWSVLLSAIIYLFNVFVFTQLLKELVLNSQINFDFNDVSAINMYTVVAVLSVFLLFMIMALLYRITAILIRRTDRYRQFLPVAFIVFTIGDIILYLYSTVNGFLLICMSLMVLGHIILLAFPPRVPVSRFVMSVVLLAGFLAIAFNQFIVTKENEYRKLFANKILNNQNFENETQLVEAENRLIGSNAINQYFYWNRSNHNEYEENLNYKYFGRYLKNFTIEWMRYDSCGNDVTPNPLPFSAIDNIYNSSSHRSISNYFLYIKDASYLGGYVAKYEICPQKVVLGHVFILLKPKIKSNEYYFEDFFDKNDGKFQSGEYAYAIYANNDLIKGLGTFPFKLNKASNFNNLPDNAFYEEGGYSHLVDRIDQNTILIVSKKAREFRQNFHIFSFLLLFYLLLVGSWFTLLYGFSALLTLFPKSGSATGLRAVLLKHFNLVNYNNLFLGTKIRMALFILVIFSFGAVIYFTLNEVNRTFNDRQDIELDKKMALIINELETDFTRDEALLLKHLSNNYEVDINLFNNAGRLMETTSNKVYDEGLLNEVMNPRAYFELAHNNKFVYKQTETIGVLKYESMYNALFDGERNLVGYINLPYFSKSVDLNNEFSKYLGSLLNVFTMLLLLTFLIATAISRTLTDPLKLIIKRIAEFRLGGQNKPISWQQNDEIGQLVSQYNHMVKELEVSTEKLAKSEREGAWREMAKQVAHEIKNPLTPMKLNIQFLQMAWARKDQNIDDTFSKVSTVLINQIDALSTMAEAFSSFAKMPDANLEQFNLSGLIEETVNLFRVESEFDLRLTNIYTDIPVVADKVQLQRVFTNILKNARQAGKEYHQCCVEIEVSTKGQMAILSFKDNGTGISDDLKDKIFSPNFSTKTSGMGLGLAMSKKIVESLGGTIWFESVIGQGTTFFVSIPIKTP